MLGTMTSAESYAFTTSASIRDLPVPVGMMHFPRLVSLTSASMASYW